MIILLSGKSNKGGGGGGGGGGGSLVKTCISCSTFTWMCGVKQLFHVSGRRPAVVHSHQQVSSLPSVAGEDLQEQSFRDNGAFVQFRVPAGVPWCTLSSNLPLTFMMMMMTCADHYFQSSSFL